MAYDDVLAKFSGVRQTANGWSCFCPVHEAGQGSRHNRSLWLKLGRTGVLICNCKKGCPTESVLAAVGLQMSDLFPDGTRKKRTVGKIAATYDYRDEQGRLLFQSVRMQPKSFQQRRPDPTDKRKWLWSLGDTRLVLYRLPELVAANGSRRVVVTEGEKASDAVHSLGFLSTTNPLGALKWNVETDAMHGYGRSLEGCDVTIIGDADPVDPHVGYSPGNRHVDLVAEALQPWAARIRKIYALPGVPEKGDAYDWVAAGGTARQLSEIINATPIWHESPPGLIEMRRVSRSITEKIGILAPKEWLKASRDELAKFDRQLFGVMS
jgi:putative DNA primase/helicase